ncbi:MAG: rhomboid family intramembrane serine protease [Leptospiraceae bacterium]|nr:rhomboid family intramembrane serine protease [Leptospiraceae bacterium]MDW7975886.1 rhomboid family intramembrane serine protease [Leptospiraceae bacterium]
MQYRKNPLITKTLIFLNITIHLFILIYGVYIKSDPLWLQEFYFQFGLVPVEFWNGSFWQPFTAMFLHGYQGLSLHLLVNMIALWSLGSAIEVTIGSIPFTWLYFISGLFGSLFVVLFQSDLTIPTIGASGAVMGLLAALAIFYPKSTLFVFFFPMKARTAALIFGLGSLVLAFIDSSSNISHIGHFGGFIGGFLYTKLALQLKIGDNQLYTYKDPYEELEEEIEERIKNIEELRQDLRKYPFTFDSWDERDEPTPKTRTRKIYFDPETGKFYIIE